MKRFKFNKKNIIFKLQKKEEEEFFYVSKTQRFFFK